VNDSAAILSDRRALRRSHFRARAKVATDILKTSGLAATAGGLLEPLLRAGSYNSANLVLGLIGLALLVAAIYIAPHGEKHE
jgi:hypothetical protein